MKYSFSIVIPVYNESKNVETLSAEIIQAIPLTQYQYEIIFVNDGSSDDTTHYLEKLSQQYSHIQVVSHRKNYGQSAGLVSGVKTAIYPWIITLDGDGQNDPNDILSLFNKLEHTHTHKPCVVFGNRRKRNDNWIRKYSSRIGNNVRRTLLKDNCPDTGCSLKLFPRDAFLALPHFNHLHRFLPALFKRAGFSLINVPVNHRPRVHGVSKYGVGNRLWVGISDLLGVMWLIRRPCHPEIKLKNSKETLE